MNDRTTKIQSLNLINEVVNYEVSGKNYPIVQAIDNRDSGFYLELSDVGKYIRINSADAVNVYVRDLEFPLGSVVTFEQTGAGAIVISASGVILHGNAMSNGQYTVIQIIKVESNIWTIIGGIEGV